MFKINTSGLKLNKAALKHKAALLLYADTAGKMMEAEAKREAKWTDRTTNARQSIKGGAGWEGNQLKVVLSGGMDYSPYLELANERRYEILRPTIEKNAAEILRGYQKLVKD